ncbi:MAG: hypothetical protein IPL61_27730 [Myxococcales bacterium]|nr:hypothetical protein [Myxococcales bacterium]
MSVDPAGAPTARLLISPDGSVLARVAGDHIDLINATTLVADSEVGIDPGASECDVALLAAPVRLVVVARHDGTTRVHTVDPHGPTAVGELTVRAVMYLAAGSGDHLWLTGPTGSAVVNVARKDLAMWPLPLRTPIHCAGAFSGGRFVASTAGLIEEWDPISRAPVRRFRLNKPAPLRFVGGGTRQVWMVPATEGPRVEVIPLVNHGQPARVELPEPAARVVADGASETLLIIGASGAAWTLDLSGRSPLTPLDLVLDDGCWLPSGKGVVVAVRGGGLEVVPLAGRADVVDAPPVATSRAVRLDAAVPVPVVDAVTASGNVADRLTAWRERVRAAAPRAEASGATWVAPIAPPSWRDHVAAWTRSVMSGTGGEPPTLADCPLAEVGRRFALPDDLAVALTLLYGAHLCGHDGVAAVELAGVVRSRWDEALGRGTLAALGVARWRRGRVRLRRALADALDELPPRLGTVVDSEATPPTSALAIVADDDVDLLELGTWLAPQLGPLLVPNDRGRARPARYLVEARARGAWPFIIAADPADPIPPAAIVLVPDDDTARLLGVPIIARWSRP